jgi:energy-converting hydrogenase Eha subunit E
MSMHTTALIQGVYYVITGLWPLLHMGSFQKVTGPKVDTWLVKMVGLLAATIGIVLLVSRAPTTLELLGILSAAAFAAIDFYYSLRRRIARTYMADGFIQILFIIGWLVSN